MAAIISQADDGCSHCVEELKKATAVSFPQFIWKYDDDDYCVTVGAQAMKQAKVIPFKGNPSDIDPFVEKVASELSRSGLTNAAVAAKVGGARGHRMSPETVANVRDLTSRRPQAYTLEWLLWACGKRFAIVNL